MKKSKNKYSPWPAVALCLVFLALRIVDLALFTDPETSFPTVGPSAARWGAALVGAAALLVMGRRADEKIAPGRKSVLGVMMAVTGTVLVLAGLSQLLSATVVWPSMVLLTAAGVWFFAMGWRVLSTPEGRGTAMPPNAVQCLIPTAALLWVLIQRFSIIPAASARLGCTFRVLGALGALLCVGMLCKLLYVPGGTYGCTVQQYGSLAFYFATCHELPQAIFELVRGSVSEQTLLTSLAMGCIGLCGLVLAELFAAAALGVASLHWTAVDHALVVSTLVQVGMTTLLNSAVLLPLNYRFGYEKAKYAFYLMVGLVAALMGFGVSANEDGLARNLLPQGVPPLALLGIVLIVLGLYSLSWRLSVAWYGKAEQ